MCLDVKYGFRDKVVANAAQSRTEFFEPAILFPYLLLASSRSSICQLQDGLRLHQVQGAYVTVLIQVVIDLFRLSLFLSRLSVSLLL